MNEVDYPSHQGWLDNKKRPLKQKIKSSARHHPQSPLQEKVSTFMKYIFKEYKAKLIAKIHARCMATTSL
jgi:hypothetical protein